MYTSAIVTAIFGGLVATGGAMGYAKKRSVVSLASGLAFGAVYAYIAMLLFAAGGNNNIAAARNALWARLGVSVVLATVMGVRAVRSGKVMPAGAVSVSAWLLSAYTIAELQ